MGLLESALLSVCVSASAPANEACAKAIEAGSKQSGIEQMAKTYEKRQLRFLKANVAELIGKNGVGVMGGTAWLTKSLIDRKASFGLPNFGLCDKLIAEVGENRNLLLFKWTF